MAKETGKAIYSKAFREVGKKLLQECPEFASPTSDDARAARQAFVVMYAVATLYEAEGFNSSDKVLLGRLEKLRKALESASAKVSKAADSLDARIAQLGLGIE